MLFNRKALTDIAVSALCLALVAMFQFHELPDKNRLMQAGDAPPSRAHDQKANLENGFVMGWNPYAGPGAPGEVAPPDWQSLVYLAASDMKAAEWIMAISLFLSALFFAMFLRERGYSLIAAVLGGVAFGFSPSIATFTFAGHVGRFVMMAYSAAAFWATQRAIHRRSIPSALWAGLFMAYAMMNDGTTGLLMMLGLAVFVLHDLIVIAKSSKQALIQVCIRLAVVGAVAIVAIAPQAAYLKAALSDGSDLHAREKGSDEHWEWATQWSLPPQEMLAFVSAGYYGLDSWNDRQPYWGRLGRSFGWEKTHQGFRNFSQTNAYLGLIPIMLLFVGLALNARRLRANTLHDGTGAPPSDTIFWLVLGLLSLLTAFGRYFPLPFHLFTSLPLPLISSFRNPVKFLVLINLCTAVLAAQGLEALVAASRDTKTNSRTRAFRCLAIVAAAFTLLFAFCMMSEPWAKPTFQTMLASLGMQEQGRLIVASMRDSLMVGLGWSLLIAILAGVASVPSIAVFANRPRLLPILLTLLVCFDFIGVNRRYVRYDNVRSRYADNAILADLRAFPDYRARFMPPTFPLFQMWAVQQSRLYGIRSIDGEGPPSLVLPLMEALQGNAGRLTDLLGIRHIILPRQLTNSVPDMLGSDTRELKGYGINQRMDGQLEVAAAVPGAGQFALVENPSAYATPRWYANATPANSTDAMAMLADPAFNPDSMLLVDATTEEIARYASTETGEARYLLDEFSHNRIRIKGAASQPGWLLINEPFHPAWQAEVDGKAVPIRAAFGVFRAVPVERGEHTVVLSYRPKATMFWLPLALVAAALAVSILAIFILKKSPAAA